MEELLKYPFGAGVITFSTSLIFIYLRTINVKQVAEGHMVPAIISGFGVGTAWLVSTAVGVSAMLTFEVWPIMGHLAGGAVGTFMAMVRRKK